MRRLTMIVLPLLIAHHLQRLSLLTAGVSGKQQFDESREIVKIAEVVASTWQTSEFARGKWKQRKKTIDQMIGCKFCHSCYRCKKNT